jgi:hypothetical protein
MSKTFDEKLTGKKCLCKKHGFCPIDHFQIALDQASRYLRETYDEKGVEYLK